MGQQIHRDQYSRTNHHSSHPQSASLLRDNKEKILQRFVQKSREILPAANAKSTAALENSLPILLDDIALALENKIHPSSQNIYQDANHGEQRAQLKDFTLDQVLHEYAILRRILFSLLEEEGHLDADATEIILDCLQKGIEEAGREFLTSSTEKQQRLNQEIEIEKNRFKSVMSQMPAGVIFAEGPSGKIIFANKMMRQIFGRELLLVNSFDEYKAREGWHMDGSHLQSHEWPLARAIQKGETVVGQLIRIKRPDGQERILRMTANPIRDEAHSIVAGVVVCEDITEQIHIEQERRKSEEKFQTLLNKVPAIVWHMNKNTEIEYVSFQFQEITGLDPEDAFGTRYLKVLHPEDAGPTQEKIREAKQKESQMNFYHRIKSRTGGWRWMLCRANPIFDKTGGFRGWIGKWTDIHEQKLIEDALKESEAKFRELANTLPMMIWTATPEGYVDWYNDWWYKYLGVPAGTTWDDPEAVPMHPEDVERTKIEWPKAFKAGAPFNTEQRFKQAVTGEYRWHLVRGVPIRDAEGNVTKYVGANTDIHLEKEHQQDAQFLLDVANTFSESLDLNVSLQNLAEKLIQKVGTWCTVELFNGEKTLHPVGVSHHDPEKIEVIKEMRREYPYSPGSLLCPTTVARSGKLHHVKHITEADLKQGTDEKSYGYLKALDLKSLVCVPLISGPTVIGAIMVVSSDEAISEHDKKLIEEVAIRASTAIERTKLYKELGEKNQELDRFAAIAAHDLKSPLITITQFSELLAEDFGDKLGTEGHEYLDFIINAGNRMRLLIDRLLEYARAGSPKKDFKRISTKDAITTVKNNLLAQIEETGTQLTIDEELPEIFGDEVQLQQLFQNLIANAIKFHKPAQAPKIDIEVLDKTDYWLFKISDQGIGMEQRHQERVFEIFSRAHKGQYEGSGIGLAVSKRIVENHGGHIWVESVLGKGTTFFFTLPKLNQYDKA